MCQSFTQEYTATPTKERRTYPVPSFYKGNFYGLLTYYGLTDSGVIVVDSSAGGHHSIRFAPVLLSCDTLTEQIDITEFLAAYEIAHAAIDTAADAVQRLISIPSPVLNHV